MTFLLFIKFSHQFLELNAHAQALTIGVFLSDWINYLRIEVSMTIYYDIQEQIHVHSAMYFSMLTAKKQNKKGCYICSLLEDKSLPAPQNGKLQVFRGENTLERLGFQLFVKHKKGWGRASLQQNISWCRTIYSRP